MPKLTVEKIEKTCLKSPGKHSDGSGLWLYVTHKDRASWNLRFKSPVTGKQRELGLGRYKDVPPNVARIKANEARVKIRRGRDPVEERRLAERPAQIGMTVREAAEAYIKARSDGWRSPKSLTQWKSTLDRFVLPTLGNVSCKAITREQVLGILTPLWESQRVSASRLRGRMERLLNHAAALEGWVSSAADWKKGLEHLLIDPKKTKVCHHPALPLKDVQSFWDQLRKRKGVAAKAVEFTILTASRSRPVRLATWSEVDLEEKVWTCPWDHMKGGEQFRVPLSEPAVELLRTMVPLGGGPSSLVFPGLGGCPLSENSLQAVLHRMSFRVTIHGFRSTFRDWAAECTDVQSDIAEAALDHTLRGGQTRSAYQRGDLLAKRRVLMDDWSKQMVTV